MLPRTAYMILVFEAPPHLASAFHHTHHLFLCVPAFLLVLLSLHLSPCGAGPPEKDSHALESQLPSFAVASWSSRSLRLPCPPPVPRRDEEEEDDEAGRVVAKGSSCWSLDDVPAPRREDRESAMPLYSCGMKLPRNPRLRSPPLLECLPFPPPSPAAAASWTRSASPSSPPLALPLLLPEGPLAFA